MADDHGFAAVAAVNAPARRAASDPGPAGAAALEVRSLYRFFRAAGEETLALQGVSLVVTAGEVVVVTGPSGSGKSTLLACMAGLDEPDGGTVLVEGQPISHQSESVRTRLRARRIGFLAQSGNLFDHLSVASNLAFVRALAPSSRHRGRADLLAPMGLGARAGAYPGELSGGETTRAGLAVALANDPAVVLADEPTGELDGATEAGVLKLLVETARRGTAVLIASHSPGVAAAADRCIRLENGRVVS